MIPETPREYKKRIDEKWEKNEKNKEKLIKKIEGYELLDEGFKTKTKQEILANFEKNQKAELEGEQYTTIVSELGKIDKKYEELDELKKQLKEKRLEKNKIEKEIKGSKLDGLDETTLKLQMGNVRKLNENLEKLKSEIDELNNEINNRELEIGEIEDSYGKIIEENISDEIAENSHETKNCDELDQLQLETLKEVHEETIKELWSKDKTRKDIVNLLDSGTRIDDELKERLKGELFEKFFEYYDNKQSDLKVKSARYMKNKIRNSEKKFNKICDDLPPEEKNKKFQEIEKQKDMYGVGYLGKLGRNNTIGREVKGYDKILRLGGKPVYQTEDKNGKFYLFRGEKLILNGYDKISQINEVSGELIITGEKGGIVDLLRGDNFYNDVDIIETEGIKPKYYTCIIDGKKWLMHGKEKCGYGLDKTCKIGEIKEIGGKPVFSTIDAYDDTRNVYWGDECCGDKYRKIGDIKDIGGKPAFLAISPEFKHFLVRGYQVSEEFESIENLKDIGGKPVYIVTDGMFKEIYRGYERCGRRYENIRGDINDEEGTPSFYAKKRGKFYRVVGYEETEFIP